jgi:hypothetical protein
MPIIYNSVTQFVETIGRRAVQEKPNTLDTLDCIFTGPAELALSFLPRPKTPHPEFPLMYCQRAEILSRAALVAEVKTSYIGKLAGAPSGIYATAPEIQRNSRTGSISYTTTYSTSPIQLATASYTIRYTAKSVSFKYLTNHPNPPAKFASAATPYLGTTNLLTFQSAPLVYSTGTGVLIAGVWSGYLNNTLVWQNDLTNFGVYDLDNGWYEVTENYTTQPHVNSSVV